uniref:Immunoglobulin V-set domain-containing protein n=1 Tax=Pundamilia nyererei TaxID=303518 RepID=A0A3B4FV81_9CICH
MHFNFSIFQHSLSYSLLSFFVMFSLIFFTGSSLSDQVHQNPANMYKNPEETAEIACSHSIDTYNQILWYKQTKSGQLQLLGYMLGTSSSVEPGVTSLLNSPPALPHHTHSHNLLTDFFALYTPLPLVCKPLLLYGQSFLLWVYKLLHWSL